MMKKKVLIVEDEKNLLQNLKLNLEMEEYAVSTATTGGEAIRISSEEKFDLIILDVMLPEMDGITVCENIRLKDSETPILFLSAKSTGEDRVLGLKKGGDDYLAKPFNLEELLLRISKLIQRGDKGIIENTHQLKEYAFGPNYINFETFEARGLGGSVRLTKKEGQLLKLLIENKNEVVSREKIFQTVWGYTIFPSTRTIDNFILAFRKYFESDTKNPKYFISLRGIGYLFKDE